MIDSIATHHTSSLIINSCQNINWLENGDEIRVNQEPLKFWKP